MFYFSPMPDLTDFSPPEAPAPPLARPETAPVAPDQSPLILYACAQEIVMAGSVNVVIPVEADVEAALTDTRKREAVGRTVSRILRPHPDFDPLLETMERVSDDAAGKGLTSAVLASDLAAHKAERTS
jgi:hypothetical protein